MSIMDFDEFENSSSIHEESRHQPSRRNAQPPSESEELDDITFEPRDRDAASSAESVKKSAATDGDGSPFGAVKHRRTNSSLSDCADLMQRIQALERRLASTSNSGDNVSMAGRLPGADTKSDLGVIFENGIKDGADQQEIIPQLCERNWSEFMNKSMEKNNEYAIEVLAGEPDYYHQTKASAKPDRKHGKSRGAVAVGDGKKDLKPATQPDGQLHVPNRIRVNSMPILKTLKTFDEHIDTASSMVMMRPFKFLVHFDLQIRDSIRDLEHQLTSDPNATPGGSGNATSSGPSTDAHDFSLLTREKGIRQETLEHMRCLVDFMDRYIKPTTARMADNSNRKIQFMDLWYLFKPGCDIYMPIRIQDDAVALDAIAATPETFHSRYNQLWRVTGTSGGRPNISVAQKRNASLKSNSFKVDCYYIDFHGRYFRPTVHTFEIMPYKGERDITALEFYPKRYMEMSHQEQSLRGHLERGKVIFDAMAHSFTHFFYSGPTLMVHPCGCPLVDGPSIQEHIESEVIVDFKMTLRKHPSWQPKREPWKDPVIERCELQETFPVQYWTDHARTRLESIEYDQVYNDYFIDRERAALLRSNEQIFAPIPSGWLSNESMVTEKDIGLLPGRVYAFVLRTRTFAPLWLWSLQPIEARIEGLNDLQLKDNTFKDTLQALVKTHFMQTQAQNSASFEYDIVRGKGKGLVLLLHGAPGVGKTFTAESVAAANGQPLLQITCGDLGLKPKEVDEALKEIFHYAQHWKCVLLLDECDIFLTERNKADVKRNALVSVFLRVLEFYTGVLFLTTNRVGTLDEAIRSRITWISYYPRLNWPQTKEIWKTNISRVKKGNKSLDVDGDGIMKYAKQHFRASVAEESVWNGRRIQNAFKVGTALANWETYGTKERGQTAQLTLVDHDNLPRSKLSARHINTYATGTRAFDKYVKEATGATDAERAFDKMERADDYISDDDIPVVSPGYDGNQFPGYQLPHDGLRRTASTSLVPPPTQGRAPSPNKRPLLAPRLSSSQLLQHQHSPSYSRSNTNGSPSTTPKPRRRSSQLNTLSPLSSPVIKRKPSTEHRRSVDHGFMGQSHAEYEEDTGIETEETDDYLGGNEPNDETSDSDD